MTRVVNSILPFSSSVFALKKNLPEAESRPKFKIAIKKKLKHL